MNRLGALARMVQSTSELGVRMCLGRLACSHRDRRAAGQLIEWTTLLSREWFGSSPGRDGGPVGDARQVSAGREPLERDSCA